MSQSLRRRRLLGLWSDLVTGYPRAALAVAAVITLLSLYLTITRLDFQSDRNALISADLPWNKRFMAWESNFAGSHDLFIAIDTFGPSGADPVTKAKAQQLTLELGKTLEADTAHVKAVVYGFPASAVSPKAVRLLPMKEFEQRLEQIAQAGPVLQSTTASQFMSTITKQMRQQGQQMSDTQAVAGIDELSRVVQGFRAVAEAPDNAPVDLAALVATSQPDSATTAAAGQWQFLESLNQRFLFLRVTPKLTVGALDALELPLAAVRQALDQAKLQHPGIDAGVTGIQVIESDETVVANRDATFAGIGAFVFVTGLLVLAYHSWRMPLLGMLSLMVGLAWTYGFTTIFVGHLQVLSVIIAPILLGLGDAFAVHVAVRFEIIRHKFSDDQQGFRAAMREAFMDMGPGIITGALITAAAFGTTAFTQFTGVAEMGLISAAGIVLCLVAVFLVFPPLLGYFKSSHSHITPIEERSLTMFHENWFLPFSRHPYATLVVAAILTGSSLVAVYKMHFNYDLMALQPAGVPSVQWSQRIADQGGQSIWSGVSVWPSLDEARKAAEKFRALPTVGDVWGVGILFPADEQAKLQRIKTVRTQLGMSETDNTPATTTAPVPSPQPQDSPSLAQQLNILRLGLSVAASQEMPANVRSALASLSTSIDALQTSLTQGDASEQTKRQQKLDDAYSKWRSESVKQIQSALDPTPLTPTDMPAALMQPYVGKQGGFAVEVFPKIPDSLPDVDSPLHPHFLPSFITDMRSVDPDVTGVIVQIYESGDLIKRSYVIAGLASLLVIFAVLWLDFRSIFESLLALLPVVIGFSVTFGIMWLSGMSINAANIIVLPLMFGLAVDAGVHMLHRYHQHPSSRPLGLSHGTGKGVAVTTLTTIVGFLTMVFASHRGIASLGFVLTIGLSLTLLACLTVMPAALEIRQRRRERKAKNV
jgi:uncharacterized protein